MLQNLYILNFKKIHSKFISLLLVHSDSPEIIIQQILKILILTLSIGKIKKKSIPPTDPNQSSLFNSPRAENNSSPAHISAATASPNPPKPALEYDRAHLSQLV
jgi:hypothetical protein